MVNPGEILAVMGPSGSGKSTPLHCLSSILVPDSGEITFADQLLTRWIRARSALRRDRFGFVFQFGQLVPELTAQENVALPLSLGGTSRSAAMGEAAMWFGGLGLDGLERRRSGELSGGATRPVAPGPKYYLIVALGLVAALAILGSTLPMLSRITGPEASRFD